MLREKKIKKEAKEPLKKISPLNVHTMGSLCCNENEEIRVVTFISIRYSITLKDPIFESKLFLQFHPFSSSVGANIILELKINKLILVSIHKELIFRALYSI